ncbi:TRAP transporter small permease [Polynucleobacter kasalickyi]|nr:TRAP transporter small permease [Polynucleobacter kasalickyi]
MTTSNSQVLKLLGKLCQISAIFGGLILVALALMTLASVIGRAFFSSPIQGDIELVQLGCAVCVACFLPYTQYQRANIIVDFFTDKCSDNTKQFLDGFGTLLIGLCFSLLAWRLAVGGLVNKENGETSMLMSIPVWIPYLLMVPGFTLTALVSFAQSIQLLFSKNPESV